VTTPPSGQTWRSYYYAGGQRVTMRVRTNSTNVVYYLHADHLGSTSLATCGNTGGCNGTANGAEIPNSRAWYHPYGTVRAGGSSLPTDYTFTGQRNEAGIGLMDYHARFYDPALGRFVQADSIVPSPGNPQSLNRYSYCLGNPLRYVDPTGYFTKEQIIASLTDQYGEEMANKIWDLWLLYDPGFMWALHDADFRWSIWASDLAGQFGQEDVGTFQSDGDRIFVGWVHADGSSTRMELAELQGQGGYQVSSPSHIVPDNLCYMHMCGQGQFGYDDNGIVGDTPIGNQDVVWEKALFGLPSLFIWTLPQSDIRPALWSTTDSKLAKWALSTAGKFETTIGWVNWLNTTVDYASSLLVETIKGGVGGDGIPWESGEMWSPDEWKP
jgi:RHS repeat-associated protein